MPTDGAHAKFLYTILKQLDLKTVDWNAVAAQLNITNGHAARMRFSRFKQQMEGVPPIPRRRAGSVTGSGRVGKKGKKEKAGKEKSEAARERNEEEEGGEMKALVKPEVDAGASSSSSAALRAPLVAIAPLTTDAASTTASASERQVFVKCEPWKEG